MPTADRTFEEEVLERLARIETMIETASPKFDDHEKRLRTVEKRSWLLAGGATVIGALLGHHLPA